VNNLTTCIVSYGKPPPEKECWTRFVTLAESVRESFGWSYTDVGLSFRSRASGKIEGKGYKYSKKALQRLADISASETPVGGEFTWAGPDGDMNIGARIVLNYFPDSTKEFCNFALFANQDILPSSDLLDLSAIAHILRLADHMAVQEYGFVHVMPREKAPGYYFADMGNSRLTQEEEHNLERWEESKHLYNQKMRDIYWGNLISKSHGGLGHDDAVRIISEEVGEEHVIRMEGGRCLFTLPFEFEDIEAYDRNLATWRERLRKELAPFDLFM
jgi:hypothetical protein